MKKQIIAASMALTLASGLQAVTIEELEARLIAAENTITDMNSHLTTVDTQIAELQSFHNIRQITINGSDTTLILKDKLASLNYQSGEFLYLTTNSTLKSELCTSNPKVEGWINNLDYTWWGYDQTDTWITLPSEPTWNPAYKINAYTTSGSDGSFYLNIQNDLSYFSEFYLRHSDTATEFYPLGTWGGATGITLKVATTRLEACGF